MSKAEERALEAYPPRMMWVNSKEYDDNKREREIYIKGYHQAEEDLALTWEDIRLIDSMGAKFAAEHGEWAYKKDHYEEILRQFNEQRGGKE